MTLVELLSTLRKRDIRLWVEDGRLRYDAPAGSFTPDLLDLLKRSKTELITFLQQVQQDDPRAALRPADRGASVELSFAQQRLWFIDQMEPGNPAYNVPAAVRLSGQLSRSALEHSLNLLVERHEILRTTFHLTDQGPRQVIAPSQPLTLALHELQSGAAADRDAPIAQIIAAEIVRPFNLTNGPLLRAMLLRLAPDDHMLLIVMHHIITDGWSMGILVREVAGFYAAAAAGRALTLPPLPVQYADYAIWQRAYLQGTIRERRLGYWTAQLADLPTLELPLDRPRPAQASYQGAALSVALPAELHQRLQAFSQAEGVTLFMTLLAAFQLLLARYSRQTDIAVGTPIAGRTQPEVEDLIGFFVNTLVLRTDLAHTSSFRTLVQRVRAVTLEAYAHQDLPFELVVEALQPERDLRRHPLFQVLFALQNVPIERLEAPGLSLSQITLEQETTHFDLSFIMLETEAGLTGTLQYSRDLFDPDTIERMAGHFQTLLAAAVAQPDWAITDLPLLAEAEQRQLLMDWNTTTAEYPQAQCIHQLFQAQVERTPDAVALVFEATALTYSQLNCRANQLAHLLQARGVGPDTPISIYVERSAEMIIGVLGILKAGGCYLPLDPTFPAGRLALMMEDAGAQIVLTQRSIVEHLPHTVERICFDDDRALLAGQPETNPTSAVTPNHLVYLMYTSGSTGRPKGVAIEHRSLHNYVHALSERLMLPQGASFATVSTIAADLGNTGIYVALCTGGVLHVIAQERLGDAAALAEYCVHQPIDCLKIVPSHLGALLAAGSGAAILPRRRLVLGGEASSWELIEQIQELAPGCTILNHYGPTETTVGVLTYAVTREQLRPHTLHVPLGRPIGNTQCYILDERLQPVPLGVVGELFLSGAGLARGYHQRPDLTAERFLPHPFAAHPGLRIYRTGDRARYRADGTIEYLGRIDHQIKIRGFRIELGEIEAALKQHPQVQDASVNVVPIETGDKQLVGYVATRDPRPTPSDIQRFLGQHLPAYMVPSSVVMLDALPLTANGKVDRRALPIPDLDQVQQRSSFVGPRTPTEEVILRIWQKILGVQTIGVHDNFFARGGHSLLATQLIAQLRATFQITLPLRVVFEHPTIAGLDAAIRSAQQSDQSVPAPALTPRDRSVDIPLSFAQQRLWFLDQLDPDHTSYLISLGVRIRGQLDVTALEAALNQVVQRHEVLRTSFSQTNAPEGASSAGRLIQHVHPQLKLTVSMLDLRGELSAAQMTAVEARAAQPFDLTQAPLLRATLFMLAQDEYVLLFTLHHIITDGWSRSVLIRDLIACYQGLTQSAPVTLAPLPIQYADYAMWQRSWLQGEVVEQQLSYWRQRLGGAPSGSGTPAPPVLDLPADRPRPLVRTTHGARLALRLPANLSAAIQRLSQHEGTTLFMTLLAALDVLLYRWSGQPDIVVGTPIAGRSQAATYDLIGCFVNTLVLRTTLDGQTRFRDLLHQVREMTLGAYAHQDLPFELLVDTLQPERSLSYTPLFQVMLVLHNTPQTAVVLEDVTIEPLEIATPTAKFDLTLTLTETESGLIGGFEYSTDLFDPATIERLVAHFQTLLAGIVADPDQPIGRLPLLSAAERHTLLVTRQPTAVVTPVAQCLHQVFEAQVARTPQRVAVSLGQEQLTYQELDAHANQLARYLLRLGVRPETHVGLYLHRSLDLLVGMLAILKAGAAYVPIDPTYPVERVAFMVADMHAPVIVTHTQLAAQLAAAPADHAPTLLCLDRERDRIAHESTARVPVPVTPDQLAYVIYTSGSTGRPKGTLISHAQVVRLFSSTQPWFHFDTGDVWTLFHSAAFDFSVWEIWGALLHGGRLVIVPYLTSRDPEMFYDLVRAERVTVLNQTPSAFRQVIAVDRQRGSTPPDLALRLVIFGGEALELQSLRPWFARHGDEQPQLVNMYGITETTVHVTYRPLTLADLHDHPRSVIGGPIPDLRLYVCDPFGQLAPLGAPGELYVGGAGVARGYLHRPALTAERFVPDPFAQSPEQAGARLYRTGDLARYLPTGDIEYLGRIDQQVKLRGFRIELGEIEAALQQHPAVRDAVVLLRDERLVAYVVEEQKNKEQRNKEQSDTVSLPSPAVADEEGRRDESLAPKLRDLLSETLPDYMIPAAFVLLPALPLTTNGKLDRKALPAPEQNRLTLDQPFAAPQTPAEQTLAEIWSQVLGVDRVGMHDNFFALGGDSIRSIQVLAGLREHGLSCSLQQLFQHQTIHALAQAIAADERSNETFSQPFSLITDADRARLSPDVEDAYPLTMLQTGMLFHSAYSPDTTLYENLSSFHLRVPWDEQRLRAAIQHLLDRHPILRTAFDLSSFSQPLQLVQRRVGASLRVTDLRHLSHDEQEAYIAAWFEEEQRCHFDWTSAPLLRFHVHRRSDASFQFTMSEHHAILDGWSVAALLTELFQRYVALLSNTGALDSSPLMPFREFVALERQALESEAQAEYWLAKLIDHERTTLPPWTWLQPSDLPADIESGQVAISPHVSAGLHQLARTADVPLKSVLLAAHLRVLSLLSGRSDVVTGLVTNGRPEVPSSERTLGLFLNTVPLRITLSSGTWIDAARRAFAAECELLPFRRYPMGEIQRRLGSEALFEVAFNFVHFHVYQQILDVSEIQVLSHSATGRTNFTLVANVSIDPASGAIRLSLEHDPERLRAAQIVAIATYYARTLEAMAHTSDQHCFAHSLLSTPEVERLLSIWNATQTLYPQDQLVHQRVEEWAARTPEALAVHAGEACLTYADLNLRANQLAHHLQRHGIGPEMLVGLYTDRSPDLIVAALAVLKAGAAYVPLDPAYPQERIVFMLESAQVALVLTQAHLRALLPAMTIPIIPVDQPWPVRPSDHENPGCRITPDQLAYVIYTSGSTGQPKGVAIQHQSLLNLIGWHRQRYAVTAADRATQLAGPGFDAAVWELWPYLASGASIHLVDPGIRAEPARLVSWLAQAAITICFMPTPLAEIVLAEPWPQPSTLRYLLTGGDVLRRYPPHDLPWTLVNHYGPTEYTVVTTSIEVSPEDQVLGLPPIGYPIANTEVFLLDEHLQLVPVGVPGEVYIGGAGLARGYIGRPDLTAERFIPHPFAAGGERLYKTGDLARYRPDGTLEFLGRSDHQVKVRGFRIELGEIEAALKQHPDVRDTVVLLRDQRLVAYVVEQKNKRTKEQENQELRTKNLEDSTDPGSRFLVLGSAELRQHLGQRLPEYMLPSAFVVLPTLPLTPNGKLDRRALPAPADTDVDREIIFVAPRTGEEQLLARIWSDVLGVPEIGVHDNFFALGGHSLLAVRLIARVQQEFNLQIPLQTLVQSPTIAQFALVLDQHQPHLTTNSPIVPIQPSGNNPPLFFIHPVGGTVLCYAELAAALGTDQPLYGIQSPGVEGELPGKTHVESLAAAYLNAMRVVQPKGPYLLGGWSFGGLIAYDMARQLHMQSEQVAAVLLLDTALPSQAATSPLDDLALAAWFAEDLAGLASQPAAFSWEQVAALPAEQQLASLVEQARTLGIVPNDLGNEQIQQLFAVFKAHVHAAQIYQPQAYTGNLSLIVPEAAESDTNPRYGWQALVGGTVNIQKVKGTHYTMLRPPHVQQVAEHVRLSIAEALKSAECSSAQGE